MKTITSARYDLVPSIRATSVASLSPTSFIAAIPVILSESPPLTTLALVEPTSPFCCIHEALVSRIQFRYSVLKRELLLKIYGHELRCDLASLELTLADKDFFPWVRFPNVPVAIVPAKRWIFESVQFVLGYESCLQHLKITFAFRHRYLRASTSSKFDVAQKDAREFVEPSGLIEAEELFRGQASESAVAMAAAALEERLSQALGKNRFESMSYWVGAASVRKNLPPNIGRKIRRIGELRNEAVHHSSGKRISRVDAQRVIRDTRDILRHLWLQQRGPVT